MLLTARQLADTRADKIWFDNALLQIARFLEEARIDMAFLVSEFSKIYPDGTTAVEVAENFLSIVLSIIRIDESRADILAIATAGSA